MAETQKGEEFIMDHAEEIKPKKKKGRPKKESHKVPQTYVDPETGMELNENNRNRVWACIIYPGDSAPEHWQEILDGFHAPIAVSPLHTGEMSTKKGSEDELVEEKPHRHVIFNFEGKKSFSQMVEMTKCLNGTFPIPVSDLRAMTRYLIHLDQPNKKQYDRSDIITFGGYDIETTLMPSKAYDLELTKVICNWIEEHDINEFQELCLFTMNTEPCWFDLIANRSTNFFVNYLRSRRNRCSNKSEMERLQASVSDKYQILIDKYDERLEALNGVVEAQSNIIKELKSKLEETI